MLPQVLWSGVHFAQACPYQAWMKPESLRSIHSRERIEFLGRVFLPGRVTTGGGSHTTALCLLVNRFSYYQF